MTQYLSQQSLLSLLVGAFLLGVAMGAVYQLFRIRRAAFDAMKISRWISVIWLNGEDLLFLIGSGCAITVLFYALSGGVFRIMALPVLMGGLFTWRLTLGRLIDGATQMILRWVMHRIVRPIACAVRFLWNRLVWMIVSRIHRLRQKSLLKLAKKETARYGAQLERVLAGQGRLPDGIKNRKKDRIK